MVETRTNPYKQAEIDKMSVDIRKKYSDDCKGNTNPYPSYGDGSAYNRLVNRLQRVPVPQGKLYLICDINFRYYSDKPRDLVIGPRALLTPHNFRMVHGGNSVGVDLIPFLEALNQSYDLHGGGRCDGLTDWEIYLEIAPK